MRQEERVLQTKRAFRSTLLQLMQSKPINKITVRELTDLTGYNRSTFYLYYQDIFALKEDLEAAVFEEVWARMERHEPEEVRETITPLIRELFDYANNNREVFFTMSNSNSYLELTNGVKKLVQDYCYSSWDTVFPEAHKEKYEPFFHYLTSGLISLVMYWITDGKESLDEISNIASRLVYSGVDVLYD